jgi:hypothetical protein
MVCSIDLNDLTDERVVSKQLKSAMLKYMNSEIFNPVAVVDIDKIKGLFK